MNLLALDGAFHPLGTLPYLNLQWRRRYHEPGSFSAQILAADYSPAVRYLRSPDRPEIAMVQQTRLTRDVSGDFVQLSGSFLEAALNRVYAYPHIRGYFSLYDLGKRFIEHPWYRVDLLNLSVAGSTPSSVRVNVDWQDEPLGDCAYATLKPLGFGQRICLNRFTGQLQWEAWQGADRTARAGARPPVAFRDDSPQVSGFQFTEDESNYRNHAVVFYGRDRAGEPYRHDVYRPGWEEEGRRWILLNVDDTLTEQERTEKAWAELAKYPVVCSAEVDMADEGEGYLARYNLGDLCDVVCTRLGRQFEARITGVDEVWKAGRQEVRVMLGEGLCTEMRRVWRLARSDVRARMGAVVSKA